ncbi:protein kinase-like protein [Streptomyces sp. HCCB10043]|uniref:caspase family protein n=1 Tax=Streptomyces TaxID=1883 RepID=UPI0001AF2491|nr:protein kinase-like protein [Streptomyces sp. HCCB10043]
MALLSDPTRSEAVLIGVHDYATLENLPAVAQNLEGLRATLTDPEVWGLPDTACTVIPQPRSAGEVLDTVRDRARRAEDTLLVYYAGHGLTDPHTDELYLAMPESDREREYTSLRYEYLRRAILDQQSSAQRTVVILDCCYSGRALLGKMSASTHIADQAVVDGTCLLTASSETRPALSPPGERYTAFTGELITTLTEGVPDRPDLLDMDSLYRHVHRKLAGKSRPLPQQRNRNLGGLIAIARNRAAASFAPPSTPAPELLDLPLRQSDAEERLARTERQAEQLRLESERLHQQAQRRARETVETAQRLASAVTAVADPDFEPFWFAVPVPRPLYGEDGSLEPVAELEPGVWYLAVEQRGKGILARYQGGAKRGFVLDMTGIEYGVAEATADIASGQSLSDVAAAKRRTEWTVREAERLASAVTAVADPDFEPFWFAVPVPRPLYGEDGSLEPVAELEPGVWYLAVEQRGKGILARDQGGTKRGFVLDMTGTQRGFELLTDLDFEPFWFAVPVRRPLMSETGAAEEVAELLPGVWHLAIDQRGQGLLALSGDGHRGILLDASGIQRG